VKRGGLGEECSMDGRPFNLKYHRDKIEQLLDSNDVGGLGDKSHIAGRELGVGQTFSCYRW
jgi:hypothetical protein